MLTFSGRFKPSDFKKMKYDPFNTKGKMKETYPDLCVDIFSQEQYIRYVILLNDKDSPLQSIKDVPQRIEEAKNIAEIKGPINQKTAIAYTTEYLKIVDNRLWSLRVSAEVAFYMLTEKLRTPIEDLESDKEKSAYQALKLCMQDAKEIDLAIKEIDEKLSYVDKEIFTQAVKEERQRSTNPWERAILKTDGE